jgi:hypothetical protein
VVRGDAAAADVDAKGAIKAREGRVRPRGKAETRVVNALSADRDKVIARAVKDSSADKVKAAKAGGSNQAAANSRSLVTNSRGSVIRGKAASGFHGMRSGVLT